MKRHRMIEYEDTKYDCLTQIEYEDMMTADHDESIADDCWEVEGMTDVLFCDGIYNYDE